MAVKNKFLNNNEKSCSWSRTKVFYKIYFEALLPRSSHVDSVGVNLN